ncbi:hypothetical protein TorRG33x02_038650 [Trema orientale]|uniref:Uncharacterized protein n=1 Tax=Trema orientale TaxID=63057 RepID=A0A2P5FRR6_TREOI|nr:hypothetical protein TorRG33x02_038650 [Trema orientale]
MRRHWRSVIAGRGGKAGQCLVLVDETGNDDRSEDENGNKEDWAVYNARIPIHRNPEPNRRTRIDCTTIVVVCHGAAIDARTTVRFKVSVYGLDNDELKLTKIKTKQNFTILALYTAQSSLFPFSSSLRSSFPVSSTKTRHWPALTPRPTITFLQCLRMTKLSPRLLRRDQQQ